MTCPLPHRTTLATLATVLGLVTGCPSDDGNPPVLWLALDGMETQVRLVGEEPRPY